jgi:hypothetical protein
VESVTDALIEDLRTRRLQGIQEYGVELQTHNGRRALVDLYEELIDAALYLKQYLMEQEDA